MSVECTNCGHDQDMSKVDTNNIKQTYLRTEPDPITNVVYNTYSTHGVCRRCNQYGIFIKDVRRRPNMVQNKIKQIYNK